MQDEIRRILGLMEDGRLSRDQAAEMIAALTSTGSTAAGRTAGKGSGPVAAEATGPAAGEAAAPPGSDDRHDERDAGRTSAGAGHTAGDRRDEREARRSRHGGRRRHRHHHGFFADDPLYQDIDRAVSAGARVLRDVMSSTFVSGTGAWHDGSNASTLSKAEPPQGADFRCSGNRLSVSTLRGLRLSRGEFCGNELNAAGLVDLEVDDGSFNDNAVSGSSLRHGLLKRGDVSGNHFNGAQVAYLSVTDGSSLRNSRFQGAQVRDLRLENSAVDALRLDGVKLKSVLLGSESHLSDVKLTGVAGTDWRFDDAQLSAVALSGWRIDGFTLSRVGLEGCVFRNDYVSHYLGGGHRHGSVPRARDLTLDSVVMKDCEFVNCTFDSTIIRHCRAEGLCFEDVDFTGMTLSSTEALAALARQADVA